MNVLGIIPARGGSKGVKRKNIRLVDGKPLIAYAIECGRESKMLTRVVVNTDDAEIAAIARQYGAEVLMRPPALGTDSASILPVLKQTIEAVEAQQNTKFDLLLLLQTTSPIRTGTDIDNVIGMFEAEPSLDGVISVVPMLDTHPARMYCLHGDGWMNPLVENSETANRQELDPVYYRNGCIYAVRPGAMFRENTLMVRNKKAYVMPLEWLANIDDERDLLITEMLLKLWKKNEAAYH